MSSFDEWMKTLPWVESKCFSHCNIGRNKERIKIITESRYAKTLIDLGHDYYTSIFHCTILRQFGNGLLGICRECYDEYNESKYRHQRRLAYGKEIERAAKHIEKVLAKNVEAKNIPYLLAWLFNEPKPRLLFGNPELQLQEREKEKQEELENKPVTDYDPKVSLKAREGCRLFRCLVCWKIIFPDDDMLGKGDGYVHALCDPEARKKRKEELMVERDRKRYEKLLNTARTYSIQSGKPVEVELRKLLYKELPKKGKMMCANKGCPHIREKHEYCHDYTNFREDRKGRHWYGRCENPACSCEQFKERIPRGKQKRRLSLSLPWRD